jgi:transposase
MTEHRKGKSIADLSCAYSVSTSTLYRWKRKSLRSGYELVRGRLMIVIW